MTKRRAVQKYPQEVKKQFYVKPITTKNLAQQMYLEATTDSTITFGVGPAGTGKSFIATWVAMTKLVNNEVSRVILTRPVVEAGENLGFLPGTLEEKIHPYLLPLLDSLEVHVGPTMLQKFMEEKRIVFAPLAYLRGRTFHDTFVILDEAQNTTPKQMEMFLTRLGEGSQIVVDGDIGQSDLPRGQESGLAWAIRKLNGCDDDIRFVEFRKVDVVRHPLIAKMLDRLEASDHKHEEISLPSGVTITAPPKTDRRRRGINGNHAGSLLSSAPEQSVPN